MECWENRATGSYRVLRNLIVQNIGFEAVKDHEKPENQIIADEIDRQRIQSNAPKAASPGRPDVER